MVVVGKVVSQIIETYVFNNQDHKDWLDCHTSWRQYDPIMLLYVRLHRKWTFFLVLVCVFGHVLEISTQRKN